MRRAGMGQSYHAHRPGDGRGGQRSAIPVALQRQFRQFQQRTSDIRVAAAILDGNIIPGGYFGYLLPAALVARLHLDFQQTPPIANVQMDGAVAGLGGFALSSVF